MRFICIDHGTKRIGIALSDAIGLTASPLHIIPNDKSACHAIADLARHHRATTVVLGRPITMSGNEGSAVDRVEKFAAELNTMLPTGTAIVWMDERLSTTTAAAFAKKGQAHLDALAAAVILQDYLDTLHGPAQLPDPDLPLP